MAPPDEVNAIEQQAREYLINYMGEDLIFITITLKPRLYKFQSMTQYEMSVNEVTAILCNSVRAVMGCELTKDGNVHYHAIVKFRDKLNRINVVNCLRRKKNLIGYYKLTDNAISHTDNLERSIRYLTKDLLDTQNILHTRNYKPEIIKFI